MYDKLFKLATKFELLATGQKQISGSVGAYQELLAGYGPFRKYTGGKNLLGVNIEGRSLIPDNPTIQKIIQTMGSQSGNLNVGISVQPNLNIAFKVSGTHPTVKNGSMSKMLHGQIGPMMHQAIKSAVDANAIMAPTAENPVSWQWISDLALG